MEYMVSFSRSDAIYENEHIPEDAPNSLTFGPFKDYVQLTYEQLRYGPDGDHLAYYTESGWIVDDPRSDREPWSDVSIYAYTEDSVEA